MGTRTGRLRMAPLLGGALLTAWAASRLLRTQQSTAPGSSRRGWREEVGRGDPVDEASEDSFPASDPPAWNARGC